jgi:hypothetical protein
VSLPEILIALSTGLVAGVYAGLLGVGGGIIMVPAMVLLLGQDQQVAQGTSLLVIIATGLSGSWANARRALIDRPVALILAVGGVAGTIAGAVLALRVLDEAVLRRIFGALLVMMAVRLAVRRPREIAGRSVVEDG